MSTAGAWEAVATGGWVAVASGAWVAGVVIGVAVKRQETSSMEAITTTDMIKNTFFMVYYSLG